MGCESLSESQRHNSQKELASAPFSEAVKYVTRRAVKRFMCAKGQFDGSLYPGPAPILAFGFV